MLAGDYLSELGASAGGNVLSNTGIRPRLPQGANEYSHVPFNYRIFLTSSDHGATTGG